MIRRMTEPTTTGLVLAALRASEDFMNYRMLGTATGRSLNQISAALFSLRKYRAVDVVVETDGVGWWYALPAESDTRIVERLERVPESKPRKPRKGRKGKS